MLFIMSCIVQFGAYKFMAYMSKATFSESGQLLDSGVDLNMSGGIAEWVINFFWNSMMKFANICKQWSYFE